MKNPSMPIPGISNRTRRLIPGIRHHTRRAKFRESDVPHILKRLRSLGSRRNIEGMARFGITSRKVFGVGTTPLRNLARQIDKNHALAAQLWKSGWLEARTLASLIDDPSEVTPVQMDRWAKDFDNWAVCDACCGVLFDKTPYAVTKAIQWCKDKREFVRRAGFVMMAELAVHDKKAPDRVFERFFPHLKRGATDNRNFVKKAVNWAVRQIGKRNLKLNKKAIRLSKEIHAFGTSSARWIASDALRELRSPSVQKRLR